MPEPSPSLDAGKSSLIVNRVIEENLPQTGPGIAFRQELEQIYSRGIRDHPDGPDLGQLPALTCAAVGGDPVTAGPVTAAWQLVRMAAKLLDDIEDLDIKTQTAVAINSAAGLTFVGPLVLYELSTSLDRSVVCHASLELERTMLRAAAGQHADLSGAQRETRSEDVDTWMEIALAKSGELFGWAAWVGALVGAADQQTQACLRDYGIHLGVLLQVADDFHGIWGPTGAGDLTGCHLGLPVCYGRAVLKGSAREHLEALLFAVAQGERASEAEAVELLTNLGAQAYLLATARVQHCEALAALQRAHASPKENQPLVTLLDQVFPIVGSLGRLADDHAYRRSD